MLCLDAEMPHLGRKHCIPLSAPCSRYNVEGTHVQRHRANIDHQVEAISPIYGPSKTSYFSGNFGQHSDA